MVYMVGEYFHKGQVSWSGIDGKKIQTNPAEELFLKGSVLFLSPH